MTVETPYGKITASKETLNKIGLAFAEAGDSYEARNRPSFAKDANEAFDQIYDALAAAGMFKDIL